MMTILPPNFTQMFFGQDSTCVALPPTDRTVRLHSCWQIVVLFNMSGLQAVTLSFHLAVTLFIMHLHLWVRLVS